ncbi:hypothetical protein MMC08_001609 [Hypocenomyce scalaris]|nr:hypothetical protein [Hypocenomyce scalaris]
MSGSPRRGWPWRSSTSNSAPTTPDSLGPRSPDDREDLLEEHSAEDYYHLSIPVMDTFRSTQFPSRRHNRSSRPQSPRTPVATSPVLLLPSTAFAPASNTDRVDLRSLDYVTPFDHNLMCAICHCPFVAPVKLDCDHIFCQECVNRAMMHQDRDFRTCPTCRSKIRQGVVAPVPKIIIRILDELMAKCVFHEEGCTEVVTRGAMQDHIDRYCDYSRVDCPLQDCVLKARRKDAEKGCLHNFVECDDCYQSTMEQDLEIHRNKHCKRRKASCPACTTEVLRYKLEEHIERCPEAVFPCTASPFGCDFIARRAVLNEHRTTCPLAKIVPFLQVQNERLEAHESALKVLQRKNAILQTSFSSIQDALGPSANLVDETPSSGAQPDPAPFDSTAAHLLSLHESLREEVERVSAAVSELDAKSSMMVMNESLRIKDEMAYTNAVVGNMRTQLQWLISSRLQNQQRMTMVRGATSGDGGPGGMGVGVAGSSAAAGASGGPGQPVRRMSDSTRQDTKL